MTSIVDGATLNKPIKLAAFRLPHELSANCQYHSTIDSSIAENEFGRQGARITQLSTMRLPPIAIAIQPIMAMTAALNQPAACSSARSG